jgi:hypothetical protein
MTLELLPKTISEFLCFDLWNIIFLQSDSLVCWCFLQAPEYSHLKVALLQDSLVRELWKKLGKQTYIEKVHPLVITNLCNSPNKITASAASTVLIGSSEELGIPITVHQASLSENFK